MDELELIGRLRDLHLPPPLPLWPPAPGWWLVALATALVLALATWHVRRRNRVRRAALAELRQLERRFAADGDAAALAAGLSVLLRRVALARAPRRRVAGLAGPAWLAWLDHGLGPKFGQGAGRALLTLPYGGDGDAVALIDLARRWIKVRA